MNQIFLILFLDFLILPLFWIVIHSICKNNKELFRTYILLFSFTFSLSFLILFVLIKNNIILDNGEFVKHKQILNNIIDIIFNIEFEFEIALFILVFIFISEIIYKFVVGVLCGILSQEFKLLIYISKIIVIFLSKSFLSVFSVGLSIAIFGYIKHWDKFNSYNFVLLFSGLWIALFFSFLFLHLFVGFDDMSYNIIKMLKSSKYYEIITIRLNEFMRRNINK